MGAVPGDLEKGLEGKGVHITSCLVFFSHLGSFTWFAC